MPVLTSDLRSLLEKAVIAARDVAEDAAGAALSSLAVDAPEPFPTQNLEQRRLRNALRARARQLGAGIQAHGLQPLVEEVAYEQWHRMLFARFLAENGLLMHPDGVPVTLQDCAELATEEGEADAWMLAARYASAMLPGIFRTDDPSVQARFAPEGRDKLERILNELPLAVFTADDALGWVYQFWQTKKKKEVNESGRKIGGADLAPVTQLFTEHYMVRFLLENSLGAWWAARHPHSPLVKEFDYLRFKDDGTPAAGTFSGWPARAAEVTVMDPCCGSGHFLVTAFEMLRRMRMEEEGLNEVAAADAVLRDNLFGLELDSRCTQIAGFALAFAAWKAAGYHQIPIPNVACSGLPVEGQLSEWIRWAGNSTNLKMALERLFHLLQKAPTIGSLIDPTDVPVKEPMFVANYAEVAPLMEQALASERAHLDPVTEIFGEAAQGAVRAAGFLARRYTLIATNVPYLTRSKQGEVIKQFCASHHPRAKGDLATSFIERCRAFTSIGGTFAVVAPQNWLFLGSYRSLREQLLLYDEWDVVVRLGPAAFRDMNWWAANTALSILSARAPREDHAFCGLDVSAPRVPLQKAVMLRTVRIQLVRQTEQLRNPDVRISLEGHTRGSLLGEYAVSLQGISPADLPRFGRFFWEVPPAGDWHSWQGSPEQTDAYAGRSKVLHWSTELLQAVGSGEAFIRGQAGWGKRGVVVGAMRDLPCTLYSGDKSDTNVAVIIPKNPDHLNAIWAFCQSPDYKRAVRQIDQAVKVTNSTLVKVPFDLERWMEVAEASGELPDPYSGEPTQWVFGGHPVGSTAPLHVAVARLLGYRWPRQATDILDSHAPPTGIVCLPAVAGELNAAEQLRILLAVAFGSCWSTAQQERLLTAVGLGGGGLHEWLRDEFFFQHCRLFRNRPFIWHIWDGRKDGFSAFVNYHKLDAACLNRFIYTYLGAWISSQRSDRDAGVAGADGRLVAALELQKKLEAIRDGEPPYDIYVRWKPLDQQPTGWNPDLNDGVRLNIRPFVLAGVLRAKFTVNWTKDRGTNPDGSERRNDLHFTVAEKRAAQAAARS